MTFDPSEIFQDPKSAAQTAGLRYQSDDVPGITRKRQGKSFIYRKPDGTRLKDRSQLERIKKLGIPPAWTDVWISPNPKGHMAATGRDARGRKQYRYNPDFVQVRDSAKYSHLIGFAELLPGLRKTVARHMAQNDLSRERVLATIVYLLENTRTRIGNERYAQDNKSFGLTTLRNKHVRVKGNALRFEFQGKSGKVWRFSYKSPRVARVIRACQDLPGQQLFEYRDSDGRIHKIGSTDVNAYLREISGADITAKDFRTWLGTVAVATALCRIERPDGPPRQAIVKQAIAEAAALLGNTVAVCRKCYVHPAILEAYEKDRLKLSGKKHAGLSAAESAVLRLLKRAKP